MRRAAIHSPRKANLFAVLTVAWLLLGGGAVPFSRMLLLLLALSSFRCRRCTTVVDGRVRRRSLSDDGDLWWSMTMMMVVVALFPTGGVARSLTVAWRLWRNRCNWHCRCRHRLRPLLEAALRRGLVVALTMMFSAGGRGDRGSRCRCVGGSMSELPAG